MENQDNSRDWTWQHIVGTLRADINRLDEEIKTIEKTGAERDSKRSEDVHALMSELESVKQRLEPLEQGRKAFYANLSGVFWHVLKHIAVLGTGAAVALWFANKPPHVAPAPHPPTERAH